MEYPAIRNLDGVFYRICRNGVWMNVCYSDLIPSERAACTESYSYDQMKFLANRMADALHQLGDSLNISADFADSPEHRV